MKMKHIAAIVLIFAPASPPALAQDQGLWSVYEQSLQGAKYIDLTHVIAPNVPVWHGFAPSRFERARAARDIEGFAQKGEAFTYEKHGLEATRYDLASTRSLATPDTTWLCPGGRRCQPSGGTADRLPDDPPNRCTGMLPPARACDDRRSMRDGGGRMPAS